MHKLLTSVCVASLTLATAAAAPQAFAAPKPAKPKPTAQKPANATAGEKLVTMKGKQLSVEFRQMDFDLLDDPKAFVKFLDDAYLQMHELTGHSPVISIHGGKTSAGIWGYASLEGIVVDWGAVPGIFKDFNNKKIAFGLIHEMGHCFDARNKPRWYITPHAGGEEMANLKLSFVFDRLLRPDNEYRVNFGPGGDQTGWDFNNNFYLPAAKDYLADPTIDWTQMSVDSLHAFHLKIARTYGWDVLKKWFRAYPILEAKGFWAPDSTDVPERIILECALLTHFAKADLMPIIKEWRLPVTPQTMAAAEKHFGLKEVYAQVEKQYAKEVKSGEIKVDKVRKDFKSN
jgi:hypothetical protein